LYLNMERSAAALFGVVTYGGMLDNTVGGGIASGMKPFETIVKECEEEASLPEDLIREKAKPVGVVTYAFQTNKATGGEVGLMQPEVEFVYDLELPEDVTPKPNDDEVEAFYLWDVAKVSSTLDRVLYVIDDSPGTRGDSEGELQAELRRRPDRGSPPSSRREHADISILGLLHAPRHPYARE
jgi:8-oxo-dGTP pyrophosphatase MutT (NUDIX family)